MKKIHWVLLVVVGLLLGSWWFSGDSDAVTCSDCGCAEVACCETGVCDVADCDCACKE